MDSDTQRPWAPSGADQLSLTPHSWPHGGPLSPCEEGTQPHKSTPLWSSAADRGDAIVSCAPCWHLNPRATMKLISPGTTYIFLWTRICSISLPVAKRTVTSKPPFSALFTCTYICLMHVGISLSSKRISPENHREKNMHSYSFCKSAGFTCSLLLNA